MLEVHCSTRLFYLSTGISQGVAGCDPQLSTLFTAIKVKQLHLQAIGLNWQLWHAFSK